VGRRPSLTRVTTSKKNSGHTNTTGSSEKCGRGDQRSLQEGRTYLPLYIRLYYASIKKNRDRSKAEKRECGDREMAVVKAKGTLT